MRTLVGFAAALALASVPQIGAAQQGDPMSHGSGAVSQEQMQQRIQQDLTQAGLEEDVARRHAEALASDVIEMQQSYTQKLEQVRSGYAKALSSGDIAEEEAQQKADQLAQELADVTLPDAGASEQMAQSESSQPMQTGSEPALAESDRSEIQRELERAGLSADQIAQLEQGGFERDAVEQAVQQAKVDAGIAEEQAQQEAQQIAMQVDEIQSGVSAPAAVAAGIPPTGANEILQQRLEQAGVEPNKIEELQQAGFPKDRTVQAIQEAHVKRGQEEAQTVSGLIDQLQGKQEQGGSTP